MGNAWSGECILKKQAIENTTAFRNCTLENDSQNKLNKGSQTPKLAILYDPFI